MNASFKIEGIDALKAQLEEIVGVELAVKALARAARRAFLPVLETARALATVESGDLRDAIQLTVKKPSSGDAVVVVGLRIGKGRGAIDGDPPSRRWHFVEFGTAKIAAHPFLRPALDRNATKVLQLLNAEVKAALDRAIRKARK